MDTVTRKGGLLYPMLVIAAISVIVFSATGIATMMGWLPNAFSGKDPAPVVTSPRGDVGEPQTALSAPRTTMQEAQPAPPAPRNAQGAQPMPPAPASCGSCGVVESIRAVEAPAQTSWLGAVGGAVVGGLLGNQVGHGGGRTAATVVGAGAGAYAGNEIEKHVKKSVRYRVRVRMEDGTYRTFHEATQPAYAVGEKVRVTERGIAVAAR